MFNKIKNIEYHYKLPNKIRFIFIHIILKICNKYIECKVEYLNISLIIYFSNKFNNMNLIYSIDFFINIYIYLFCFIIYNIDVSFIFYLPML